MWRQSYDVIITDIIKFTTSSETSEDMAVTLPSKKFVAVVPFLNRKLPDGRTNLTAVEWVWKTVRGEVGKFQQVTHILKEKYTEFLESDRRYTYEELAQELNLGNGVAHSMTWNRLGMQKVWQVQSTYFLTLKQKKITFLE